MSAVSSDGSRFRISSDVWGSSFVIAPPGVRGRAASGFLKGHHALQRLIVCEQFGAEHQGGGGDDRVGKLDVVSTTQADGLVLDGQRDRHINQLRKLAHDQGPVGWRDLGKAEKLHARHGAVSAPAASIGRSPISARVSGSDFSSPRIRLVSNR